MDWLGCETDVSDQSTLPLFAESTHSACNEDFPDREDRMAHIISPCQPFDPSLGNHQLAIDSDQPRNNEREFWPAVLDCGGNESWPFDYTSNQGFRKIKLPPLREVLEQTMGNTPNIKAGTVKDLIRVLSTPYIPSLSDSLEIGVLPTITFLGDLVKTYFAEFHPSFSIIHIPTWQIEKCPTALLAAIACIGATYSTADGSQEVASILAEISQRSLFWMVGVLFCHLEFQVI